MKASTPATRTEGQRVGAQWPSDLECEANLLMGASFRAIHTRERNEIGVCQRPIEDIASSC